MKKVLLIFTIFAVWLFIFPQKLSAQVVINEVSSASDLEWVELYNISSASASLKGYSINFGTDSQNKFFCDGETISENSYKIISLTSHWLADSGDVVTLKNGDDVIDTIGYGSGHSLGKPSASGSISRSPDGSSNWILFSSSSQRGSMVSFDCPIPAPIETPQSTSTPTPVPTPAKTSTPVPTPTRTPTPTKSPSPTPTHTPEGSVLGEETIIPSPTVGMLAQTEDERQKNKFPFLAIVLVIAGVGLIGFSVFTIIKNAKKSYTIESGKEDGQIF